MILSDVIDRPVFDASGSRVGFAVDFRFVLDGAPTAALSGAVLQRILISPRTGQSFFGYERSGVRAPWLLADLLKLRHRGSFFVNFSDVAQLGRKGVILRDGYSRLPLRD